MTDNSSNTNQETEKELSEDQRKASIMIANEFMSRATLGEALSQISFHALAQITQNKALSQAEEEVLKMSDEELTSFIRAAEKELEKAEKIAEETTKSLKNPKQSSAK
jgi:hypothetical protein